MAHPVLPIDGEFARACQRAYAREYGSCTLDGRTIYEDTMGELQEVPATAWEHWLRTEGAESGDSTSARSRSRSPRPDNEEVRSIWSWREGAEEQNHWFCSPISSEVPSRDEQATQDDWMTPMSIAGVLGRVRDCLGFVTGWVGRLAPSYEQAADSILSLAPFSLCNRDLSGIRVLPYYQMRLGDVVYREVRCAETLMGCWFIYRDFRDLFGPATTLHWSRIRSEQSKRIREWAAVTWQNEETPQESDEESDQMDPESETEASTSTAMGRGPATSSEGPSPSFPL